MIPLIVILWWLWCSIMYAKFCGNPPGIIDSNKSKDLYFCDSCMKYMHRFLAYYFSCQKDAFIWYMVQKKRVNLGFWLASQFSNIISFKRPLILGSVITCIVIYITDFDIEKIDLHIACPQIALDLGSLDDIGLLHLKDDVPCFALSGPIIPTNMQVYNQCRRVCHL